MNTYVYEGKIFEPIDNDTYVGDVVNPEAMTRATTKPTLKWKGGKIPYAEYAKIIAFFRWTYGETKGESQTRAAYSSATREWVTLVLPQRKSFSMHSQELETHPERAEALKALTQNGFCIAATFHHHCQGGAFQSGTDLHDELRQNGLHVTIGHVDRKKIETHCRLTFRGFQYDTNLADWIDLPIPQNILDQFPDPEMLPVIQTFMLEHPPVVEFPAIWKERLIAEPVVTQGAVTGRFQGGRFFDEDHLDDLDSQLPWMRGRSVGMERHAPSAASASKKEGGVSKVTTHSPIWEDDKDLNPKEEKDPLDILDIDADERDPVIKSSGTFKMPPAPMFPGYFLEPAGASSESGEDVILMLDEKMSEADAGIMLPFWCYLTEDHNVDKQDFEDMFEDFMNTLVLDYGSNFGKPNARHAFNEEGLQRVCDWAIKSLILRIKNDLGITVNPGP